MANHPMPYEAENLIRFHQAGLNTYRQVMSISAQTLVEQTIKALKDLQELQEFHKARR